MKTGILKNSALILCLIPMLFSPGCEKQGTTNEGTGTLQGKISIGPLCPVETVPPDPACQPTADTYKAYPVSVYSADMKTKVADLKPALDGSYSAAIPSGIFMIVLDKQQSGAGGSNLPVSVEIKDGSVTELDVNIDTGIR